MLGIDLQLSKEYKEAIFEGYEIIRMGYVRMNFAYFFSEEDKEYLLDAIEFICRYGWMLLPHYSFDTDSSVWTNRSEKEI